LPPSRRHPLLFAPYIPLGFAPEQSEACRRHTDGEAIGYRITDTGLAAVGVDATAPDALERVRAAGIVEPTAEARMPHGGAAEFADGGEPAAGTFAPAEKVPQPLATPPEPRTGLRVPKPRRILVAAAQAVLLAWDANADRTSLDAAIAALRSALARKPSRTPRDAATPRQPREGTKQQQVLALLRRPEGATIAQIAEVTGWQTHTVRGFSAGLRSARGSPSR
jgi:hypothetical protein